MKKKTKNYSIAWTLAEMTIYGLLFGIVMSGMFGLGAIYYYITNSFIFVLMKTLMIMGTAPAIFILLGLLLAILESRSNSKNKRRSKK